MMGMMLSTCEMGYQWAAIPTLLVSHATFVSVPIVRKKTLGHICHKPILLATIDDSIRIHELTTHLHVEKERM